MATSLTGMVRATCQPNFQKTLDLSTPKDIVGANGESSWNITNGTGANQADKVWHDQRTITAGATDDLDLAGVLTDAFGDTFTIARIKALYIKTNSASTANLEVGGALTNPIASLFAATNDKLIVRGGGGAVLIQAPDATAYAVAAGSADTLRLTHDASTSDDIVYNIIIVGASA